jgi:hypothetical protein
VFICVPAYCFGRRFFALDIVQCEDDDGVEWVGVSPRVITSFFCFPDPELGIVDDVEVEEMIYDQRIRVRHHIIIINIISLGRPHTSCS